jgi:Tfp pilus assembly protein PilN
VSIEAGLFLDSYSAEAKRIWITLFDHLDDDMYDGDLTYDDSEIPRILLEFKEADDKAVKTTHRVTSSATKGQYKREKVTTVTSTTKTTTNNTSSPKYFRSNITTTERTSNEVSSPSRYQQTTTVTRTTYEPKLQFEIGEEPQNSVGFNSAILEQELRIGSQNAIDDLKDEQASRFELEDSRVDALGTLERAHEELKGSNEQDIQETRRLTEISRQIDSEISIRKTKISTEIDILKQKNIDVEKVTKESENEKTQKTKEKNKLETIVNTPEDLNEQGFSKEAKEIRNDNSQFKTKAEKGTAILIQERDQRDELLDAHNKTVQTYNETIYKFMNLLNQAEQTRKIHGDHLHEVQHEINVLEDYNDRLDQKSQITDIDLEFLMQQVNSLRKDLSSSDKIYSQHITELSEILVEQTREIGHLNDAFNATGARNRDLEIKVEKQKLDLQAHENEMDSINAIGYNDKINKLQDDLKRCDDERRKHQDELENTHDNFSTKLQIFKTGELDRKRIRDQNMDKIADALEKLKTTQETINELLRDIDAIENKLVSDANKDTVGASLEQEKDNLNLKLRWATEERDNIYKDLQEAITLLKSKQREVSEQEQRIRELRREISELRTLIEEKKRIIAELEAEIEKCNERIDYLRGKISDLDKLIHELRIALAQREARIEYLVQELGTPKEVEINYRAVKGDEVDEMLALYMKDCPVPVKRLGNGFYLFGTRKIFAKIMNGKLVVRVGGGYMFISEFIVTYSDPEIAKLTKICENLGIDSIWDIDLEELYYSKNTGGGSPLGASPKGREGSPKGGFGGNASFKKSLKGKSGNASINGTNRQKVFNASALVRKI